MTLAELAEAFSLTLAMPYDGPNARRVELTVDSAPPPRCRHYRLTDHATHAATVARHRV